jgi:hypothetical protein
MSQSRFSHGAIIPHLTSFDDFLNAKMEEKFKALMGTHHSSRNFSHPSNSVSTNPPRTYG